MSIAVNYCCKLLLHCKITALGKWSYPDVPDGFFPVISFWQRAIWKHLEIKQGTWSDDVCSKLTNRVIIQPVEPVVYRPALLFGSWRWATYKKKRNCPFLLRGHWLVIWYSCWRKNPRLDLLFQLGWATFWTWILCRANWLAMWSYWAMILLWYSIMFHVPLCCSLQTADPMCLIRPKDIHEALFAQSSSAYVEKGAVALWKKK